MLKRFTETENICWGSRRNTLMSPAHWHSYFEIEFLYSGNAVESVNGANYNIGGGTVTLFSPDDFHSLSSLDNNSLQLLVCCIKKEELSADILRLLDLCPPPYIINLSEENMNRFTGIYELFFSSYNSGDLSSAKIAAQLIISLCITEAQKSNIIQKEVYNTSDPHLYTVRHIITYIKENYNKNLTRENLAELFNFSPNHISKIFKKVTGISLFEHIINVRMEHCVVLLKTTNLTIGEIINKVGYNSPSLFYRHFYNRFGVTPNKIKKIFPFVTEQEYFDFIK